MKQDRPSQADGFCGRCGHPLADDFDFCPGCGVPRAPEPPPPDIASTAPSATDQGPQADAGDTEILGFEPEAPREPGVTRSARRRRLLIASAIGLALLMVVAMVGLWGWRHYQDNQVVAVFRPADASFAKAVAVTTTASSRSELAEAADKFTDVQPALDKAHRQAESHDSDTAREVVRVLDAEIAFASAVQPLADPNNDLVGWGQTRADLIDALAELHGIAATRHDLITTSDAFDTDAVESNVDKTVGTQAAATAADALDSMFANLQSATTTAQLRDVGSRALERVGGLRDLAAGFDRSSDQALQLESFADLYDSLGALTALDGDHLDQWAEARSDLLRSAAALDDAATTRQGAVRATHAVDALVHHAQQTLREWRVGYEEAKARRAQAVRVSTSYRAGMGRLLDRYAHLRTDLSTWIDRVQDPSTYVTWDEAYRVLSDAQWQRQQVRDDMGKLTVPAGMTTAHDGVLDVIDDAIDAVAAAYEGVSDAQTCQTSCYYADTPGWQRFQAESDRITSAYQSAQQTWEQAMQNEIANAEAMRPPDRPEV